MNDAAARARFACISAFGGNMDLVRAALAAGPRGLTDALFEAVVPPQPHVVKMLAAGGADVSAKRAEFGNCTPLHLAITLKSIEMTKVLIECGADVNALDGFNGWTPLMWSAADKEDIVVEIAKILIAAGADVNYKDDEGTSALDLAAKEDFFEMASILLGAGARVNGTKTYSPNMVEFFGAEERWMRRKIWVAMALKINPMPTLCLSRDGRHAD